MRKISLILIISILISLLSSAAYAQEPVNVDVDGKAVNFDVPPQIMEGRTMVPMRGILEALGMELEWDAQTRTITARNKDYTIILPLDSRVAIVNGKTVMLDAPAKVVEGRTMVPARFISESAGAEVKWNADTRTVSITSVNNSKNINNSNNISGINNSTVSVNNTNIDNSVSNSNNTTNNYNYSTTINNNITNNITVNVMDENMLRRILGELEGTKFLNGKQPSGDNKGSDIVEESADRVVRGEAPVIIPLEKQPDGAWKDEIITYDEVMKSDFRLAFTLPKGVEAGEIDEYTGGGKGFTKIVRITDKYESDVACSRFSIGKLELESGIGIVPLNANNFAKLKDGESYKLRINIEKDGQEFSEHSAPVTFMFKDNPQSAFVMKEIHISGICKVSPEDGYLYNNFGYGTPSFAFEIKPPAGRVQDFALERAIYNSTLDFVLRADGVPDVKVKRKEYHHAGKGAKDPRNWCFAVALLEPDTVKQGVKYQLVPENQNENAKWVVDEGVYFIYE